MSTGKIMSIDELKEVQKSFIEATQTDEPVAIETPTGNHINGDTTKYGLVTPKDYEITLYLPIVGKAPEGARVVLGGKAYEQKVQAKERFISARVARKARNYTSIVAMAFTGFQEDGSSEPITVEDVLKSYALFDDTVIDACEKLVSVVLDIPHEYVQYITDTSLMKTCYEIIKNNQSFFQED